MGAKEDIDLIAKRMNSIFRGKAKSAQKNLLKQMGLASIDIIVARTRRGFGVKKTGGNRRKLKRLSKPYIKMRSKAKLHKTTSPKKSNLTFTGQMLESVKILRSTDDSSFSIGPSGRRRDGKSNADVSRWVSGVRPFMNLGRSEITSLRGFLEKQLRDRIKKA